jgi:hypothetical protein
MQLLQQATSLHAPSNVTSPVVLEPMVHDNIIHIDVDDEHTPSGQRPYILWL